MVYAASECMRSLRSYVPRERIRTVAVAAAIVVAACRREPPPEKTHVLLLPRTELTKGSLVFSDDGAAFAFIVSNGDGLPYVVSAAGNGAPHTEISRPQFAPGTHRLFYWEIDEIEGQKHYTVFADGTEVPTAYVKPGAIFFSDKGGHWAAIGIEAGRAPDVPGPLRLYANGVEIGKHDDASFPALGRAGDVASLARDGDGPVTLVTDGTPRRSFAVPTAPCAVPAPASRDEPQLPGHDSVRYFADGSLLIVTRDADGWAFFHDETRWASYPVSNVDPQKDDCKSVAMFAAGSIRKAEDAAAVAWFERVAGEDERWRVVRNGAPVDDVICAGPWRQQPPELSADGAHVAYACSSRDEATKGRVFIVKDGVRYGPYVEVWGLALSKNGAHVAYGASQGAAERPWAIYVDGEARTEGWDGVWRPLVSDDGATIAWEARLATRPRDVFGIDRRAIGSFDSVLWGPEFEGRDRVAWVLRRGHKLTRVTVPIAAGRKRR